MSRLSGKFEWMGEFATALRALRPGLSALDRMPERVAAQEWIACREMDPEDAASIWHEANPPPQAG